MSPIDPDYVDVAQRLREFRGLYPDGSLQSFRDPYPLTVGDKSYIVYSAVAFRHPEDKKPGIGWAWEPVPGPTSFTRDSELQNAETSAWGRAIVALGFETKKIASADEVRNRSAGEIATPGRVAGASAEQSGGVAAAPEPTPQDGQGQAPPDGFPVSMPETSPPKAKPGQIHEMRELLEQLELQEPRRNPTWRTMATAFAREQLDVQSWEKLTEPQMDTILEYMRPFLKEKVYPDV